MNKITYIWGAGASYGERDKIGEITRGVPIISEFSTVIHSLMKLLSEKSDGFTGKEKEKLLLIKDELKWLSDRCEDYPTIDTYAKMLFVTQKSEIYNRVKNALSIYLILDQLFLPHDLRYDGFIASLLNENKKFPSIDILTWNYDAQFELAYSDYSNDGKYIMKLWENLNVISKTITTENKNKDVFSIAKLNGTALFIDRQDEKTVIDIFNGGYNLNNAIVKIGEILDYNNLYRNTLSYSWEKNDKFISNIVERVKNTTSLVIIGYSFPYVNREIDRVIIQSMESLKKIYIQDPFADDIKENVQAVLLDSGKEVSIITKKNTKQFFIPNEL